MAFIKKLNVKGTVYDVAADWTNILNKPATYPPNTHYHSILHDPLNREGIKLDSTGNITQRGINAQAGVPATNPGGININDSTNSVVFGDSNINTTNISLYTPLTDIQADYALSHSIVHDGSTGGISNFVAGSCNKNDKSYSIITGCWNTNTGYGHDSFITGLNNINGAQYSLVAGRNNKVGTVTAAEAQQGGCLVVGKDNYVQGQQSLTVGEANINNHRYSNALGLGLKTSNNSHTVVGRYNAPVSGAIFSVGTGSSSSSLKTAFAIDSSSNILVSAPTFKVGADGFYAGSGGFTPTNGSCYLGTGLVSGGVSNQVIVGRYNDAYYSGGDSVFVVGNGEDTSNRHTLLAMQSNGTCYLYGTLVVADRLIANNFCEVPTVKATAELTTPKATITTANITNAVIQNANITTATVNTISSKVTADDITSSNITADIVDTDLVISSRVTAQDITSSNITAESTITAEVARIPSLSCTTLEATNIEAPRFEKCLYDNPDAEANNIGTVEIIPSDTDLVESNAYLRDRVFSFVLLIENYIYETPYLGFLGTITDGNTGNSAGRIYLPVASPNTSEQYWIDIAARCVSFTAGQPLGVKLQFTGVSSDGSDVYIGVRKIYRKTI